MPAREILIELELPPGASVSAAVAHVQVEDTTLADQPARVVTAVRLPEVTLSGGERLEARLALPENIEGRRYTLRAHLDVDGDGEVGPGDFITTDSRSARPDRFQRAIRLTLRPVPESPVG